MSITILICTHNRADLLERVLASINSAVRPAVPTKILVAANACTDDTIVRMHAYQAQQAGNNWLPLRVIEIPTPGKSHALNRSIPEIDTELVAFVDDDHRLDKDYLVAILQASTTWPDAGLYCGRILPDWDGTEPSWVHDEGPYRIYPLPVPRYDQGLQPKTISASEGPIPGGGNLVVRRRVFGLTGQFSTELGPHGHDLGGGEDSEFVLRAMTRDVRCQYAPEIVQYHYVDSERLKLTYLLKKGFQRTRSTSRIQGNGRVPFYMWRKLAEYGISSTFSLSWARRRFYWVRFAAALGEVQGRRESGHRGKRRDFPLDRYMVEIAILTLFTLASGLAALLAMDWAAWSGVVPAGAAAGAGTAGLLAKSLSDFSQTGPRIRDEILTRYNRYTLFALARLSVWAFGLMWFMACGGTLIYYSLCVWMGWPWSSWAAFLAGTVGLFVASGLQFARKLRLNPGLLVASMHYRMSRLYPLWRWATPGRIRAVQLTLGSTIALLLVAASWRLGAQHRDGERIALWAVALFYSGVITWAGWLPAARVVRTVPRSRDGSPNIVLIGSDTLRADRLGLLGYRRALTPNIDALATKGALFANCYVPCARTAPSLVSLMTGTWPHTHGIRDNFVADSDTRLKVNALPQLLKAQGYYTAALSDWCGADMGKLSFGFDYTDLPDDQWNLKYFLRQGPKDLRLFVSLFTHNRLGRHLLPELYYLGGAPLTVQIGHRARRLVSRMATEAQPFFLNVFYSTTHPPFASEWPWYTRFADDVYAGESKFAMAKLADPFDIIRRQGAPREEFDLDQIINLYDGCVAQFDDEVGRMLEHLGACGLAENTVVVVYSDHGMDFFEHDTWGQGNSAIGDFSARIPMLIYDPRKPPRGKVEDVVRSIDLAPTLLDLVGHPPAAGMDGVSLMSCMTDKNHSFPQLDAFNETGVWLTSIPGMPEKHLRYPDLPELVEVRDTVTGTMAIKEKYAVRVIDAKDRMIRRGRWKLTYQPLTDGYVLRLFDLESDPECRQNVIANHGEVATVLWKSLREWMDGVPGEMLAH